MKTKNRDFISTHKTKYNFGGLLPEGINVNIIKNVSTNKVIVIDHCGNSWQGNETDLIKL